MNGLHKQANLLMLFAFVLTVMCLRHQKNEEDGFSVVDLALPASTFIPDIEKQLKNIKKHRNEESGMTVVFSTY